MRKRHFTTSSFLRFSGRWKNDSRVRRLGIHRRLFRADAILFIFNEQQGLGWEYEEVSRI
jgi:hypothetical protein